LSSFENLCDLSGFSLEISKGKGKRKNTLCSLWESFVSSVVSLLKFKREKVKENLLVYFVESFVSSVVSLLKNSKWKGEMQKL